jgi:hypothetical protein
MLETFGDSYRAYVARTGRGRPVDTVKPVPTEIFKSAGKNDLGPNFVPFSQHPIKNGWRPCQPPRSIRCRRGEREVSSIPVGNSTLSSIRSGDFDVEIGDPWCRNSGLRRNSSCCRPSTPPAGRLDCAGRKISHRQISHRQEPSGQIPDREGPGSGGRHQGLI